MACGFIEQTFLRKKKYFQGSRAVENECIQSESEIFLANKYQMLCVNILGDTRHVNTIDQYWGLVVEEMCAII